jgi:choline-sulfatase
MCDQLRAFEVGCYGNPAIRTPNIDRLASQGVRFELAVTNYPVCMASRSVLLSGMYNRSCTGGISNVSYQTRPGSFAMPEYPYAGRPHLKAPTLPEILREHGYRTAAIGKWHIHSWPHDIGFDHYLIPRVHHCHSGQSYTENGKPEFSPSGWSVEFEAERVEQFLLNQSRTETPFFLYYNISPPHCPLADAPEEYLTMYRPEQIPLRHNVNPDTSLKDQDYWFKVYRYDFRYYDLHLPYTDRLPEGYSLRHLIAEYYGLTTWMDNALGRMLSALEAAGLAEDTIVVFTSDHGDNLGSHGLVQKGTPNEESIRVPLVIRAPQSSRPGTIIRRQVAGLVDMAPTLLSLAGISPASNLHGRNLAPLVRGDCEELADNYAVIEMGHGAAIRTPTHSAFFPYRESTRTLLEHPTQLFDLQTDPFQQQNRAEDNTDGIGQELTQRLQQWESRTPWMQAADG